MQSSSRSSEMEVEVEGEIDEVDAGTDEAG